MLAFDTVDGIKSVAAVEADGRELGRDLGLGIAAKPPDLAIPRHFDLMGSLVGVALPDDPLDTVRAGADQTIGPIEALKARAVRTHNDPAAISAHLIQHAETLLRYPHAEVRPYGGKYHCAKCKRADDAHGDDASPALTPRPKKRGDEYRKHAQR